MKPLLNSYVGSSTNTLQNASIYTIFLGGRLLNIPSITHTATLRDTSQTECIPTTPIPPIYTPPPPPQLLNIDLCHGFILSM